MHGSRRPFRSKIPGNIPPEGMISFETRRSWGRRAAEPAVVEESRYSRKLVYDG